MVTELRNRASDLRARIGATVAAGVTEPSAPRPAWQRRGRFDLVVVADTVTAFICMLVLSNAFRQAAFHPGHSTGPLLSLLLPLVLTAPLVLRTWYPLTSWSVCLVASYWADKVVASLSISSGGYIPAILVYGLCLYAVAIRCKTWVVLSAGAVTAIAASFAEGANFTIAVIVTAIPLLVGLIVRARRGGRQELAVAEQRHYGERALLEERQRIARELHDVVAHHMSVIAIQAEAAPYKIPDPPPELVESFADIRSSALSGLSELRRVLGVLRSEAAEIAPQPGLEDLEGLLGSARSGGVTVTHTVTGNPRPLPEGVNLSAYRIVQEALSNAMRHAPGAAVQVKLYYGEAALVVEVRNDRVPAVADDTPDPHRGNGLRQGSGHGIIGMRERATMLGGHLQAGPTGKGDFLVTAALPLGDGNPEDDS